MDRITQIKKTPVFLQQNRVRAAQLWGITTWWTSITCDYVAVNTLAAPQARLASTLLGDRRDYSSILYVLRDSPAGSLHSV